MKIVLNKDRVTFVAEDGREAFEVRAGKDGRSLDVRAVETFFIAGVAYGSRIQVVPHVSNHISIEAKEY